MANLIQPATNIALFSRPNPSPTILFTALTACTTLAHLKQLHAQILRSKVDSSNSILLKLVLSSCALSSSVLDYALSVFFQIPRPETDLSNKFLSELSRSNCPGKTLLVYEKIRKEGLGVDRFSFPPLLKSVSRVSGLIEGMEIHGLASKLGFDSDPYVQTGLVRMYVGCGRIMDARSVFDKMSYPDVVAWGIILNGYGQCGLMDDVFQLFEEMKSSNVEPDDMILSTIVSACGRTGNLSYGKMIHEFITDNNFVPDPHLQSALVTMYASCGSMDMALKLFNKLSPKSLIASTAIISAYSKLGLVEDARLLFNQMVEKDLVCWSAMMAGYAESDKPQEALHLFNEMQDLGITPDQVTILSVISACANLGAINQAKWIHTYVNKNRFGCSLPVNNALIDMYAKCGSLERARGVFEKMPRKNVVSWTSMISAFAMHGDASSAVSFFYQMKVESIEPNWVTFVGVLYACSHAGLVEEGQRIFASMTNVHNITPKHEHYGCMVDLFGRANLLREALKLIESMPLVPNIVIWGSLMAACRIHGEIELGEFAAKQLLELDPHHDGAHVFLSNIYAKERRWEDVVKVRKFMQQKGISKEKGCSRIESNNGVHEFLVADRRHKLADLIYEKLDEVVCVLKKVGYTPNICSVLVDLEEEEKKEVVLLHSEKLALCYGLIGERKGSRIQIVKNLRVCEDCHTFMKLVSGVYGNEIIIRDRTRFHHYRNGVCSCKDYW